MLLAAKMEVVHLCPHAGSVQQLVCMKKLPMLLHHAHAPASHYCEYYSVQADFKVSM
jgi:hypothetical protein